METYGLEKLGIINAKAVYRNLTPAQLREEYAAVKAQFDALMAKELKLNRVRGKPG